MCKLELILQLENVLPENYYSILSIKNKTKKNTIIYIKKVDSYQISILIFKLLKCGWTFLKL